MTGETADEAFMRSALALARAQLGRTAPNPAVGCILVAPDGSIVATGATGAGGRPHAEESALEAAGGRSIGAAAFVSLEPCAERSSGAPSCAQRLIEARVARVVAACADPHPLGMHGLAKLREAGIEVLLGVLETEALALNAGFFKRIATGRPLLAIASDGSSYDAEFDLKRGESFEGALDRLGAAGLTRVFVRPGTPLAAHLEARGLVDG